MKKNKIKFFLIILLSKFEYIKNFYIKNMIFDLNIIFYFYLINII